MMSFKALSALAAFSLTSTAMASSIPVARQCTATCPPAVITSSSLWVLDATSSTLTVPLNCVYRRLLPLAVPIPTGNCQYDTSGNLVASSSSITGCPAHPTVSINC